MLATTRNVLVLNSNWCAVGIVSIHKAIIAITMAAALPPVLRRFAQSLAV